MFMSKGNKIIAIAIILFIFSFKIVPTQGNTVRSHNQEYKLAINWQPAFCETRPYFTECKMQNLTSFEATNFTLHGLWPESIYCGVSQSIVSTDRDNKWSELPTIKLSTNLVKELTIKMPGVASNLHLHEWYKHGTCYSQIPEEYYQESLALLDQINQSKVRTLFANSINYNISSKKIRNQFERAFGNPATTKVAVKCQQDNYPTNRNMITELQLNLQGNIKPNTLVAELFKQSKTVSPGCSIGEVDRAGLD
jgi:ribonuclease T2